MSLGDIVGVVLNCFFRVVFVSFLSFTIGPGAGDGTVIFFNNVPKVLGEIDKPSVFLCI
jgi:hypothetical protein